MDEWKHYENTLIPSHRFLRDEFLPENISVDILSISRETSYQVRDQETLLFIKSGTGTLLVNGQTYPIIPGSSILLHFFHFHKLIPREDAPVVCFRCLIPSTTYQFLIMIPGADFRQLERSLYPIICTVPKSNQKMLLTLLEDMAICQDEWLKILMFFRLFGIHNRLFIQESGL